MGMIFGICCEQDAKMYAHTYAFKLERSSLPSKKFLCISIGMLQIGALSLVGRLVKAVVCVLPATGRA